MQINIVCIGKLKEKFLQEGCDEYLKRLKPYAQVSVVELKEDGRDDMEKEGKSILDKIEGKDYVISQKIDELALKGISNLTFVIGGSNGLSEVVLQRSNHRLCFSKMTFTHQMIRMILLEQIYRAFKISRGEPYHKWANISMLRDTNYKAHYGRKERINIWEII